MQSISSLRLFDASELALEEDASSLLRPIIQCLQTRSCDPGFFSVVDHVVVVHVHVEQHQSERDVARVDVVFHGA